jgi:hypothetical protein
MFWNLDKNGINLISIFSEENTTFQELMEKVFVEFVRENET